MQGYKELAKSIKKALGKGVVLETRFFTGSLLHGVYIALPDGKSDLVSKVAETCGTRFKYWVNQNDILNDGTLCIGIHIKYA